MMIIIIIKILLIIVIIKIKKIIIIRAFLFFMSVQGIINMQWDKKMLMKLKENDTLEITLCSMSTFKSSTDSQLI